MTDLVGQKEVNFGYFTTDEMVADYMTKSLVDGKFKFPLNMIMDISGKHCRIGQQEYSG